MKTLLAIALLLAGCASVDRVPDRGLANTGIIPPRCVEAVVVAADTLLPDPSLRPLRGVVYWHAEPFLCGLVKAWGCSDTSRSYIAVQVALPPTGHAADSALPEEIAHFVWRHYRPLVKTEWWEAGPNGTRIYVRDPEFKAWYTLVGGEARAACQ